MTLAVVSRESGCRLVEEEEAGLEEQAAGDVEQLLFACRLGEGRRVAESE
jgi:hypothetical protein